MSALDDIRAFLGCPTPQAWIEAALRHPDILLVDHANCEKKAAATAINLLFQYTGHPDLLHKLSRLAREELRHFEQVVALMERRGIAYQPLSSARYAGGLREAMRSSGTGRLVDVLVVGAFIEARSCERFAALAPHLDAELQAFYQSLLASEARHYRDYLGLARQYAGGDISARVQWFRECEQRLIEAPDAEFRFHSGVPAP